MSISNRIALTIPSSSGHSNESVSAPSTPSTLSLPATPHTNNFASTSRITFAPLPLIEPRKRRSKSQVKLGIATRSSMMGHRRSTTGSFNPRGANRWQRDLEEEWGGELERPLASGDMWEDVEMVQPRDEAQSERYTELEDPFVVMGRMVKNAWKRVRQTQIHGQIPAPIPPNGSAGDNDDRPEVKADMSHQLSSEIERKVLSECSHGENEKADHMPSVKEDCALGVLSAGSAPIRNPSFKLKKPVLLRSVTEPFGKTTVASTFRGR